MVGLVLEDLRQGNPALAPMPPAQLERLYHGSFALFGLVFSIPLWIATVKVAALQRLQAMLRNQA